MSMHTVKLYTDQFQALKILKDDLLKLSDFELNKLFHSPRETLIDDQLKQLYDFFPVMSMQLRRRGMTVARQFLEYKALYPQSYGETSFYKHYNQWRKKVNPTMHIEHKVGDKMYVDYAGATLRQRHYAMP